MIDKAGGALVLTCLLTLLTLSSGTSQAQVCGDLDGDGRATVADGITALRAAAGLSAQCATASSASFIVTDGAGTPLGTLVGIWPYPAGQFAIRGYEVFVPAFGRIVTMLDSHSGSIRFPNEGAFEPESHAVLFSGATCNGQAYVDLDREDPNHTSFISNGSDSVGRFFVPGDLVPEGTKAMSELTSLGGCITNRPATAPNDHSWVTATEQAPPFALPRPGPLRVKSGQ